ncbi:MAG: DUF1254 domain-containing protein [Mangrovibacterium sp.]
MRKQLLILAAASMVFLSACKENAKQQSCCATEKTEQAGGDKSWKEEYAYTLGYQAYMYAYPLVKMSELRYDWVTNPDASFYAPLNFFHSKRALANHKNYTTGGSPNQDTLYDWGWVDLTDGPVILSHPEMGDRYFVFEIADMFSDNFAYVGQRTTGGKAGAFAIIPPGWKGKLPKGITDSFQSTTNSVLIFGRTFVQDEADVKTVNKLQEQYHLTPLAYWGKDRSTLPQKHEAFKPFDRSIDPLADWKTIVSVWKENPLRRDDQLIKLFSTIGISPDSSPEELDNLIPEIKAGLARAAKTGRAQLHAVLQTGGLSNKVINGWNYPPRAFGRLGYSYEFPVRAAIQCDQGIIANDPEEGVYINTFEDSEGVLLNGDNNYEIRYTKESLPQVKYFYSLTIYTMDANFVPNEMMRYSVGDRTEGINKNEDGTYTVYVQAEAPTDPAKRANWLPSPKGKNFYFVLRTYGPEQAVIEQTYTPPSVVKVN